MAHYRHGRKVPALPPPQRLAIGGVTVATIFTLVALTAWKPLLFGLPSLIAIAALGVLDYTVVMTRPVPGRAGRRAARAAGPPDDAWYDTYDAGSATTMLPRRPAPEAAANRPTAPPRPPVAPPTEARRRRPAAPLHPAYEGGFSAADDVLNWDDPEWDDAGRDDPVRSGQGADALVQTMAVDMRGFIQGQSAWVD